MWSEQQTQSEEAAWEQFRTAIDEGKDVSGELVGKSPESWALFQEASRAFRENRFDDAVTKIRSLKERFPKAPFVVNQEADRLLADAEAESTFAKNNPEKKENPAIPDDRVLTIKTDAGEFQIGLYTDIAPTLSKSLLKLVRGGSLKGASIEYVSAESSISITIPVPADSKADDIAAVGDAERAALRVGKTPSHLAGAVSFEVVDDTSADEDGSDPSTTEKPKKLRLTIFASDATFRDNQAMTFGMVKTGLEAIKEMSKREIDENGRLKAPILVSEVAEGAGLTSIQ